MTWAAYRGHAQIVRHLLAWDANPNEAGQVNKSFLVSLFSVKWKYAPGPLKVLKPVYTKKEPERSCLY